MVGEAEEDGGRSILPDGWTWSDAGHGALDVAGLIPGYGEAADILNAAWYVDEEEYLEAGLSIISIAPIVGDIIGKGGKVLKRSGGKIAGPALDALKKMDFEKLLGPLRNHPKIGPAADKIVKALNDWRNELLVKSLGITPCPKASKILGESAAIVGKTPVPSRILGKLNANQLKLFEEAVARVERMPSPRRDRAIFYSGYIGGKPSWKIAELSAAAGKHDSVNTLTKDLLNTGKIRENLPKDAMEFIGDIASKRLAESANGNITFVGDVGNIGRYSVFRRIELPALLNNKNISNESKMRLEEMRKFMDKKYGPLP